MVARARAPTICDGAVTNHWRERVFERIGPGVCPVWLAAALFGAIRAGDGRRAEFLGRVRRDTVRAFRFALGGRVWVALVQTDLMVGITVLGQGQTLRLYSGTVIDCGRLPERRAVTLLPLNDFGLPR